MKAVNLIPAEQRRGGGGGSGGRSDGAAYALVGFLAGLVLLAAAYAIAHQQVADRRSQAARITAQAANEQNRSAVLSAYTSFLSLRNSRVQAAEQLAASRFDWAHAIHEVGRVLPYDIALTNVDGSLPGANQSGSAAATSTATSGPSIVIQGCAVSQVAVAQTLARLRLVDGVVDVSLRSSDRAANGVATATDCRAGHPNYPMFKVQVTFAALPSAANVTAAAGTAASNATAPNSAAPTAKPKTATAARARAQTSHGAFGSKTHKPRVHN